MQTRHQRKAFGRLFERLGSATGIIRAADSPTFFRSWLAHMLLKRIPEKPQIGILPLKHARLQQLADADINTPHFNFWLRGELNSRELKDAWKKHGRLSLRNVTEERLLEETPKLPVEYDQDNWEFIFDYCNHHNQQYHTLVNEALPLQDSLMAGNIVLLDEDKYIVSYFEGYGTPRDVDDKSPAELRVYLRPFYMEAPKWAPKKFEELIAQLQRTHLGFSPITPKTFEFSIYPYPVGIQKRTEVFWEWRSGSAHDLYTVITRMLERTDSHELILQLPKTKKTPQIHQINRSYQYDGVG